MKRISYHKDKNNIATKTRILPLRHEDTKNNEPRFSLCFRALVVHPHE